MSFNGNIHKSENNVVRTKYITLTYILNLFLILQKCDDLSKSKY